MTEDEAKKKYCPLMPVALNENGDMAMFHSFPLHHGSIGRAVPVRQYTCQGSACMMWRGDGCGLVQR